MIETIESVVACGFDDYEHIIVDDASSDGSFDLLKSFVQAVGLNVILVQNDENIGIKRSYEVALKIAQGKYIVSVADDLIVADRVERDVKILESNPNAWCCFGPVQYFDGVTGMLGKVQDPFPNIDEVLLLGSETMAFLLLDNNYIPAMSVTFRRSAYELISIPDDFFIEDYPLWIEAANAGFDFLYRPYLSAYYRSSEKSIQRKQKSLICRDAFFSRCLLKSNKAVQHVYRESLWAFFFSQLLNLEKADFVRIVTYLFETETSFFNGFRGAGIHLKRMFLKRLSRQPRLQAGFEPQYRLWMLMRGTQS